MVFRILPRLVAFIPFVALAAAPPGPPQEKLDPAGDALTRGYLHEELLGKYGYLELAYPLSFKDDGLGSLKTKPPIQNHSQSVEDELRTWLASTAPHLDRNPRNKAMIEEIVMVLGGKRLCTRLVPYMDRYLALGGKPGYDATTTYVGGLVRLGRYEQAVKIYAEAYLRWGYMATNIASQLYGDRFYTSWLVDRNFKQMLEAQREGMLKGIFPGDRNFQQETICECLRKAAEQHELPWFVARMQDSWIWINEVRLKDVVLIFQKAGVDPPEALQIAADPLFKETPVAPAALRHRSVDSLNRGETETALRQAERSFSLSKTVGLKEQFESLVTLIRVLRQRGDLERAFKMTEEAAQLSVQIKEVPYRGWALMMKGFLLEKMADHRRAADCFTEALVVAKALGYSELTQSGTSALARALSHTDLAADVEPQLRESAEKALQLRLFTNVPSDYMSWGECLVQLKRHSEAVRAFRQAIAPVKGVGEGYTIDLTARMNSLKGMAFALGELKRYDEAEKAYDEYAELARGAVGTTYNWVWQLGKAKCAYGLSREADARRWIDQCLESIEAERASLTDFKHRRTLNENKYEAYDLAIALAVDRQDPGGAFRIAERSRARSFLDEMGAASGSAGARPTADLQEVVEACREDVLVEYYQLPDRLLAWVITGGKAELVKLPWSLQSIQESVDNFLAAIYLQSVLLKNKLARPPGKSDALVAARDCYGRIWEPLSALLPAGRRVFVAPHRSLHHVPFQALHDGTKFLIEGRELCYVPSASAFLELRKHPRSASPGVLVFDPILSDDPKSPFAKTESLRLQAQYAGGTFVLRRAATLAAFKEHAPGAGMIHVSSHGYYDEWIPMDSGLVFAGPGGSGDELLRVRDIYGMHLDRTELLVMSACVSSVGDFAKGDEVTGLTRAFQVAGIPNVIGSLWPVENEATIELMTILHRSLAENRNPAISLRRAQCELIGKKLTIDRWAAFQLTGLGETLSLGGK